MSEQQLLNAGYRKYSGEKIDVFYSKDLCEHVGNCVKGSIDVFNPKRKPWVLVDAKSADEVARIIDTCPTKALQYVFRKEAIMEITIDEKRVIATKDGVELGEMTFVNSNDKFYIIDHTGVYDAARGLGVGKKMVQAFVEHARTNNIKILPLCPFAKAEFEKNHESYADVLHS